MGKLRARGPDVPIMAIAAHFKVVDHTEGDNRGVHLGCLDAGIQGRLVSGPTSKAAL